MREKSFDEFESLFERSSIPVLDIRDVPIRRVSLVLHGTPLDESVIAVAGQLRDRFAPEFDLHRRDSPEALAAVESAKAAGIDGDEHVFAGTAELVGQVSIERSQLVLFPVPEVEDLRLIDLAAFIRGAAPPILIIRRPIPDAGKVFSRILHSLTGNFQQKQNFAYSFTLASDGAELLLLHTIDRDDIQDVREALQLSAAVESESADEVLEQMAHHGERHLKGVVAAATSRPFNVSYRLAVNRVVDEVMAELRRGDYSMLVVGAHLEGHSHVNAADYELVYSVQDVPVLAL